MKSTVYQFDPIAKQIYQGAEGRLFKGVFDGKPAAYKERFPRKYRQPSLDADLRWKRLRIEARNIGRMRKAGIDAPEVFSVNREAGLLIMAWIEGATVKDWIIQTKDDNRFIELGRAIGKVLAQVHDIDVIHGDLTTSNMMLRSRCVRDDEKPVDSPEVVLLDLGLSSGSASPEDKAVDLYVLERSIQSQHPDIADQLNRSILEAYASTSSKSVTTLKRLEAVRMRGRKRVAFG